MTSRAGPIAPVLGILLILLGLACFVLLVWANAPMEEPASPGKTPNPSLKRSAWDEWLDLHWIWVVRFVDYGAGVCGGIFVIVGSLLLLPARARQDPP